MTQEEKAKRYDEVFNAAKEWYNNPNSSNIGKSYLYAVFPELKESEDEEIRKSIIENLKGNMCRTDGDYDLLNKQIAWLEKQKEFVSEDFDDVWETADCDELTAPLEKYSKDAIKEMCHAWYDKGIELERRNWLEKQGEQKQDPCDNCKDVMLNCHNFPCIKKRAFKQGKTALEAINEEKVDNANKVEPKFKDGDVLNSPSNRLIWIYKDNEHYYACVNMNYVTENVATDGLISIPNDACPATKDEQNILFARMKDAGYEWDAKLKQLRKIEDEIEIPYGAKDSELIEESYNIPKVFHAEIEGNNVVIKKGEQNLWSEGDENIKEWIMSDINKLLALNRKSFVIADKEITWLKSLKGRVGCEVNCTTTKECSVEDMSKIQRICKYLDEAKKYYTNITEVRECIDWLKSLKDRYTWKPSDEQMNVLLSEVTGWVKGCHKQIVLESLYNDLKKLK